MGPSMGEPRGPGIPAPWHLVHFLLGLVTTMTTLLVHSIAYTYFLGTGKWVKEVVRVYRMPDWVEAPVTDQFTIAESPVAVPQAPPTEVTFWFV